eukprot:scaffold10_cov257-Pinguiococcus_pyrenoidosus.AAC.41
MYQQRLRNTGVNTTRDFHPGVSMRRPWREEWRHDGAHEPASRQVDGVLQLHVGDADAVNQLVFDKYFSPVVENPVDGNLEVEEVEREDQRPDFRAHYRFSDTTPLLFVGPRFITNHNIAVHNVTISQSCLRSMSYSLPFLVNMDLDSIVLNQVFHYFHRGSLVGVDDPHLESADSEAMRRRTRTLPYEDKDDDPPPAHRVIWTWSERILRAPPFGAPQDLVRTALVVKEKVVSIVTALFALFLMSNTTAMLVRHLIASGVALVIPMLAFMQAFCGMHVDENVVAASYPWLVLPMRQMRQPSLIVAGHLGFLVVMYTMYEASQALWANWLYPRLVANGTYLWLFALVMVLEYYSMVFLRSKAAIGFTPRMLMGCLLCYHLYIYSFPAGFFRPVLMLLCSVCAHICIYSCFRLEKAALLSGEVSFEQPRGAFFRLPYPVWQADLPPLWSVFVPPNETSTTVYHQPVPARHERGAAAAAPVAAAADQEEIEVAENPPGITIRSDPPASDELPRVRARVAARGAERV